MKVYVNDRKVIAQETMAFVEVGDGYLLCIGTADEVKGASIERIQTMILEAIALSQFHALQNPEIKH